MNSSRRSIEVSLRRLKSGSVKVWRYQNFSNVSTVKFILITRTIDSDLTLSWNETDNENRILERAAVKVFRSSDRSDHVKCFPVIFVRDRGDVVTKTKLAAKLSVDKSTNTNDIYMEIGKVATVAQNDCTFLGSLLFSDDLPDS